ncbi:putative succinyl-CoA:3-ketoacid coenzyme A transferase subunit A [Streptomyces afghaniensis 772] [Streptomyces afghaniensis]
MPRPYVGHGCPERKWTGRLIKSSPQPPKPWRTSLTVPSLTVGGFGLSGVPDILIQALYDAGVTGLNVFSNNCGALDSGLAVLLAAGRIARVTGSYIGWNQEFARQYLGGEIELELIPQGTLAERLRAGAAAYRPSTPRPASAPWWPTAACRGGTTVTAASPSPHRPRRSASSQAGMTSWSTGSPPTSPWCGRRRGTATATWCSASSPATSTRWRPWPAASRSPRSRSWSSRGGIDLDQVHLPGIFVQRVVALSPEQAADKKIEKLTAVPRDREVRA